MDIQAVRGGRVVNFEVKFGTSWYGGRQMAYDLEAMAYGRGDVYVVRGRMVEGYMFKVEVIEVSTGRSMTGRIFGGVSGTGWWVRPGGTHMLE